MLLTYVEKLGHSTQHRCQRRLRSTGSLAELLATVTSADVSSEAFPFRAAAEIDIGFARVLCIRITYLGELGYELYIPAEQAVHVYDRLVAAGPAVGLRHAGTCSGRSLRLLPS
jgi:glycine cleavage system aminomethyltransferase T